MSRLIDADALCRFAQNCKDKTVDCNDIMRMPTVDAVPVVHGEWKFGFGEPGNPYGEPCGAYCSVCGWSWERNIDAVKLAPLLSKIKTCFCPNCGAKMDLEEKDDG